MTGQFALVGDEVHGGGFVQVRWQCQRGHFVAESAIRCVDRRDDFAYYGVRSECSYYCRGCAETYQEMPRAVVVGGAS